MPSHYPNQRLMEEARGLSSYAFVRMIEEDRRRSASEFAPIEDLAAERNKSVRTLRRCNNRPERPGGST